MNEITFEVYRQSHLLTLWLPKSNTSSSFARPPGISTKKVGEEDFLIPKIKSKGMGTKSDDRFTLPLCPKCHQMLHICGNERYFLRCIGVSEPEEVALYLWKNTGNLEKCLKELTEIRILGSGF